MSEKENIHSGHRERMMKKFVDNGYELLEHELLEILLYSMLPRIDTNPIAHRLINRFGSLREVFNASVQELNGVDGVGEKTAKIIFFIGKLFAHVEKTKKSNVKLGCFDLVRKEILDLFKEEDREKFYMFLLNKDYKKVALIDFTNQNKSSVIAEVSDVAKFFAVHKPKHVIVAHNHPSGLAEPSQSDDLSTKKINLLCMAHGVNFTDHVIYAKGEVYSYARSGKLDELKKKADLNRLLNDL